MASTNKVVKKSLLSRLRSSLQKLLPSAKRKKLHKVDDAKASKVHGKKDNKVAPVEIIEQRKVDTDTVTESVQEESITEPEFAQTTAMAEQEQAEIAESEFAQTPAVAEQEQAIITEPNLAPAASQAKDTSKIKKTVTWADDVIDNEKFSAKQDKEFVIRLIGWWKTWNNNNYDWEKIDSWPESDSKIYYTIMARLARYSGVSASDATHYDYKEGLYNLAIEYPDVALAFLKDPVVSTYIGDAIALDIYEQYIDQTWFHDKLAELYPKRAQFLQDEMAIKNTIEGPTQYQFTHYHAYSSKETESYNADENSMLKPQNSINKENKNKF